MPKGTAHTLPLVGIFAIAKPSGPTCMSIVNQLRSLFSGSRLFMNEEALARHKIEAAKAKKHQSKKKFYKQMNKQSVKIGTGGTLDPLANGVLVLGVGSATKQLSRFLECSKEYRTTALLGCETDSYDSEGALVRTAPWSHVNREKIESVLPRFTGEILQMPPIYSAIKMDGKPLYEYARQGIALPRPIEQRKVTVKSLILEGWMDAATESSSGHHFRWPTKELSDDQKQEIVNVLQLLQQAQGNSATQPDPEPMEKSPLVTSPGTATINHDHPPPVPIEATQLITSPPEGLPPAFVLHMSVSGGTYVRSIVHDVGISIGSAAHVVVLTRTRQAEFVLTAQNEEDKPCIDWTILEAAMKKVENGEELEADEDGWTEWEREVLQKWRPD